MTRASTSLILVVDDSPDNREMYVQYLELSGYRTVEAGDGAVAVAVARRDGPDAVIMDLTLPVMDGWEAARIMKADPKTAAIPIIAMSGFVISRDEARDAGFDAILEKPCTPDRLAETLDATIREAHARESTRAARVS